MSNDETQPVAGSRWEPTEGTKQPAPETPQPQAVPPESPPVQVPAYAAPAARPNRGRLILAGGAVGIALVAGAGGFALGHVTAGEGRDGGPMPFGPGADRHGPQGFPGDRDGDGDHGGLPGGTDIGPEGS